MPDPQKENGFIKLYRGAETTELLKRPAEYLLLSQIALRAKRTGIFSGLGLEIGEALIGDFKSIGLTESKYRTAKKNLEKWGFITTRITNRGTIAKLINTDVFNINAGEIDGQSDSQMTDRQRTDDGQMTTNKNIRNKEVKNERNYKAFIPPSLDEAKAFFKENGYREEAAERAWLYYAEGNWHNRDGKKVKSWRQTFRGVWFKAENEEGFQKVTPFKNLLTKDITAHNMSVVGEFLRRHGEI